MVNLDRYSGHLRSMRRHRSVIALISMEHELRTRRPKIFMFSRIRLRHPPPPSLSPPLTPVARRHPTSFNLLFHSFHRIALHLIALSVCLLLCPRSLTSVPAAYELKHVSPSAMTFIVEHSPEQQFRHYLQVVLDEQTTHAAMTQARRAARRRKVQCPDDWRG